MKTLVLFSGGLKSTFLAALARREGEAFLCYFILDLEQENDRRLARIMALAGTFHLELIVKPLWPSPPLNETLLQILYLVLHALPYAKEHYCDYIYHGLSKDDDSAIVPVMDAYVKQLNALIELGQPLYNGKGGWLGQVALETPLRRLVRGQVVRLGNEFSVPWELTHSCSRNRNDHCGKCKGCRRRQRAFKQEGHEDPTPYRDRE